jgi:hypothetical protein
VFGVVNVFTSTVLGNITAEIRVLAVISRACDKIIYPYGEQTM